MQTLAHLADSVRNALAHTATISDIQEAEVFASSNSQKVFRLNYTSHMPSNGGEEPKSTENFGIGIRVVFKTPDGVKVGFGSEANNISLDGVKIALEKARQGAVLDPEFTGLPRQGTLKRKLFNYHDPEMMDMKEKTLIEAEKKFVDAGWKILDGSIEEFLSSKSLKILAGHKEKTLAKLGLIAGGDLTIIAERIAIGSTHLPDVQTDESTIATISITDMVEEYDAKGSGYGSYNKLSSINQQAGQDAAKNAINACGVQNPEKWRGATLNFREPMGLPSGSYTVIFGHQPVSDMISNLVLPGLTTGAFYGMSSPFMGKMGKLVASTEINLYDDATNLNYVGAKAITCEGLPTRSVDLIKKGVLNDLLSNWYETERLLHKDPRAEEKLGQDPKILHSEGKLLPSSGFRFSTGGGRGYDSTPGIAGTNVILEGTNPKQLEELLQGMAYGIYIGRIWYCYPINGSRSGDFTATVVGDSFVIKNGKIFAPLKANSLRINDNILRILNAVKAAGNQMKSAILWAADEIPVACDLLVSEVVVEEIGAEDTPPTGM